MVTKRHKTDPQKETDYDVELNEIDELNRINKAVDRQPPVDVTEVQKVKKDVRSNPGSEIEMENVFKIDGMRMAQDKL